MVGAASAMILKRSETSRLLVSSRTVVPAAAAPLPEPENAYMQRRNAYA